MTRLLTRASTHSFCAFAAAALLASAGCQSGGVRLFGYDQAGCCSSSCTPPCGNSACSPSGNSSAASGGATMAASDRGSEMVDPAAGDPNRDPNVMAAGYAANGCDPNAGPGDPNGRGWPNGPRPLPRGVGGQWAGPEGPPTGGVAYPYYTNRGPRDFLDPNPPPLGP